MLLTDVSLLTRVDFDFLKKKKKKEGKEKLILSWGVSFSALSAFYICLPKELENIFIYVVGGEEEPPHRFMTATARWGDLTSPFDIRFQILIIQQMRKKKRRVKMWPPQVFDCFIERLLLRGYEALPCLHHPHLLPLYSHHLSIMTLYQMQNKIK